MTTEQYRSVRARMNTGEPYVDFGDGLEQLEAERVAGKELAYDFNHSRPSQVAERAAILGELFGSIGEGVWIEPPLSVSYGSHVHLGDHVYANFDLVLVDDADIHVGDRVLFAPHVTIATAGHPSRPRPVAAAPSSRCPCVSRTTSGSGRTSSSCPASRSARARSSGRAAS